MKPLTHASRLSIHEGFPPGCSCKRLFLFQSTGGHNPALKKVDATDLDNRGESCGSLVAKANGAGLAGIERSSLDKPERHAIAIKQTSQ